MPSARSKKFIDDNKPRFPLLPVDEYILEVENIEPVIKKAYHSNEDEKVIDITFKIVSFRDGEDVVDVDGKSVDERRRIFLSPAYDEEKGIGLGFMKDGTGSKLRQFIAYITEQDILQDLVWEWHNLVGKRIAVEIIKYQKENGDTGNKISRFIAPKSALRRKVTPINPDDIPVIEDNINISGSQKEGNGIKNMGKHINPEEEYDNRSFDEKIAD